MPRKKRSLDRDSGVERDASLIVIASEDRYGPEDYFRRFRTRRVQFKVLPTIGGSSSPEAVLRRLENYRRENELMDEDQLWICIDRDHWTDNRHMAGLRNVLRRCNQGGYNIAFCNPSFELWLLLHYEDVDPQSCPSPDAEQIEGRLRRVAGGYKKHNPGRLTIDGDQVRQAMERARQMDVDEEFPDSPVARVYRIIDVLLERDSIDIGP